MNTPARGLLLLALIGTTASANGASQSPVEPPPGAPAEARPERAEKYLLHLADGRRLRVRARASEHGYELETGSDGAFLPAEAVVRAVLERDALKEAKRLAAEVDAGDVRQSVALAAWLLSEGLYEEGIERLDSILAKDADQEDALALLRRDPPPLALPRLAPEREVAGAFLARVAGAKPVAREVALLRLEALRQEPSFDLRALLEEEVAGPSARRRALAAFALRRLYPGEKAELLLGRAVLDGSSDVRREAAWALRDAAEPGLALPVLKALGSSSSAVRTNAAEALGHMGYPAAVPALVNHLTAVNSLAQSGGSYDPPASNIYVGRQIGYLQDYDVEVAQAAAVADPIVNTLTEGAVLDVRVLAISEIQIASEKAAVRTSLAHLTGASPGHTTDAWLRWWEKHGQAWLASAATPEPGTPTTPGR
jgi:hypothetical protein